MNILLDHEILDAQISRVDMLLLCSHKEMPSSVVIKTFAFLFSHVALFSVVAHLSIRTIFGCVGLGEHESFRFSHMKSYSRFHGQKLISAAANAAAVEAEFIPSKGSAASECSPSRTGCLCVFV